ncbi:MAG: hypothetical protein ABJ308_10190 [Halieaceae bacterium]
MSKQKTLQDSFKAAASNLLMLSDLDFENPPKDDDSEETLVAYQEWCGAYAGTTELYQRGDLFVVYAEDGEHEYQDAGSALQGSGISLETEATVSIWIDPELVQE